MKAKLMFHNPEYPGRPARANGLSLLLGVPAKKKLPDEGLPPRLIQGIKVWVTPKQSQNQGRRGSRPHRVKCECPVCGWIGSAGRLSQHGKVHNNACPECERSYGPYYTGRCNH